MSGASKLQEKFYDWTHPPKKRVYSFGDGAKASMELMGAKGTTLCELARLGLPVPDGFVISAETCKDFLLKEEKVKQQHQQQLKTATAEAAPPEAEKESKNNVSVEMQRQYLKLLKSMESKSGRSFSAGIVATAAALTAGDGAAPSTGGAAAGPTDSFPMLLSVRPGASAGLLNLPGLAHAVLNVGMNDRVVKTMGLLTNNPRWAHDTYARFLRAYGSLCCPGVSDSAYQAVLDKFLADTQLHHQHQLSASELLALVHAYKELATVPDEPAVQLQRIVEAMFCSWNSKEARAFRDMKGIPHELGTSIVVQNQVFGNFNSNSGTGVLFTRVPTTGEDNVWGSYLSCAEGMDYAAAERRPISLSEMRVSLPDVHKQLLQWATILERKFKSVCEVEFTVENGVLFVLDNTPARCSPKAAVRAAVAMVQEQITSEKEALMQLHPQQMDFFIHPSIDLSPSGDVKGAADALLGRAIGRSHGTASGVAVFDPEEAIACYARGETCILIKSDMAPSDAEALHACAALVVAGGDTLQVEILASIMRGQGKPTIECAKSFAGPAAVSHQIIRNATTCKDAMRSGGAWNNFSQRQDNILVIDDKGDGAPSVWLCKPPEASILHPQWTDATKDAFQMGEQTQTAKEVASAIVDSAVETIAAEAVVEASSSSSSSSSSAAAGTSKQPSPPKANKKGKGAAAGNGAKKGNGAAAPSEAAAAAKVPSATDAIHTIVAGDLITVDGSTGSVFRGRMPTRSNVTDHYFNTAMHWAENFKQCQIMANCPSLEHVKAAIAFGAEGVGSYDASKFFFGSDSVDLVREKLLTLVVDTRTSLLHSLQLSLQKELVEALKACPDQEFTLRLAEINLQDFFPSIHSEAFESSIHAMATRFNLDRQHCLRAVRLLQEDVPSLGYKGARQQVVHPKVAEMQCRAFIGAAIEVMRGGCRIKPQILIPFVSTHREVEVLLPKLRAVCDEVCKTADYPIDFKIGCSLETPSACVTAHQFAVIADLDFLQIDCCRVTSFALGANKNDAQLYMEGYLKECVLPANPFETLNVEAVGALLELAVTKARAANSLMKIGISGHLCGDPASVTFYCGLGVDFVSCPAKSVCVAKLAAAQAQIAHNAKGDWQSWLTDVTMGNLPIMP